MRQFAPLVRSPQTHSPLEALRETLLWESARLGHMW